MAARHKLLLFLLSHIGLRYLTSDCCVAGDPTSQRLSKDIFNATREVSFAREVMPALTRAGCNAGACHGSFQGRGGLQLSLLGFDAAFDHEVLTKRSLGRRVSVAAPETSLLLLKPTGLIPHGGGRRIAADSEVAHVLKRWMASGMSSPRSDELAGLKLTVTPKSLILDPQSANSRNQTLQVVASYADGIAQDVTDWALYDVQDKSIVEVSKLGLVNALRPGKTSVSVKYLGQVASISVTSPFGPPTEFEFSSTQHIDDIAANQWRQLGIKPTTLTDDSTFVRRVFLDLIGTLPTSKEAHSFIESTDSQKRSRIVDELLNRREYVDYWSLKWGDMLRAHRRYLGDKGLASFNNWIRQSIRDNKPLDVMTHELLTAQGNLFTNGPVAYFFIDEKVESLAETTSQVFLGVRLQCTKCHHHPNEVWTQDDYHGLAAYFMRLETKDSGAQGAKFGGPKSIRVLALDNPKRKSGMTVAARVFGMPSAPEVTAGDRDVDPRQYLATQITRRDNPFFARNFANRYWAALFGIGLVEPVDDLRATNPASLPGVLDVLAKELAEHHYDPKHLLRTICNSRIYQLAPELAPHRDTDGRLFTHRTPRRLGAEVLLDALNAVAGTTESFAGHPPGTRAISLPDPAISSQFLTTFGKPPRASNCECARGSVVDLSQALHLANSLALHDKISSVTGRLKQHLKANRSDDEILDDFYLAALSRRPTIDERRIVHETLKEAPRIELWEDIVWALLNSSEFVFGH